MSRVEMEDRTSCWDKVRLLLITKRTGITKGASDVNEDLSCLAVERQECEAEKPRVAQIYHGRIIVEIYAAHKGLAHCKWRWRRERSSVPE
jgi:hypothetical protein